MRMTLKPIKTGIEAAIDSEVTLPKHEAVSRCINCMFFDVGGAFETNTGGIEANCRRYPPTLCMEFLTKDSTIKAQDLHNLYAFPIVHEDEWCGEWRSIT